MRNSNPTLVTLDEFITNAPKGHVYTLDGGTETLSYVDGRFVYRRHPSEDAEALMGAWRLLKFDKTMYAKHKTLLNSYGFYADREDFNCGHEFIITINSRVRRP